MKNNKLMAYAISAALIFSTIGTVFAGYGTNIFGSDTQSSLDPSCSSLIVVTPPPYEEPNIYGNTAVCTSAQSAETIYTKETISTDPNQDPNTIKKDTYNFHQADIEDLMNKGFTLKDIFEADDIGNKIMVDPRTLLDRKKSENKSLKEIEASILEQHKLDYQKSLQDKYSTEYTKMQQQGLSNDDISAILQYLEVTPVGNFDDLLAQYKEKGKSMLDEGTRRLSSVDGSTPPLAKADEDNLKKLSEKYNVPVEDLKQALLNARINRNGGTYNDTTK